MNALYFQNENNNSSLFKNVINEDENMNEYKKQGEDPDKSKKIRNLETTSPLRITGNFENLFDKVPIYQIKLIRRAFRLVTYQIYKMISIQGSQNLIVLQSQSCEEITFNSEEYTNGIKNSDLHIYIAKYSINQTEKCTVCQYQNDARALVGIIRLDFSNYSVKDEAFAKSIMAQELFSDMFHLLGFRKDFSTRFLDSNGNKLQMEDIVARVEYDFSFNIMKTQQLKQISTQVFNCDDIQGMIIEINQGKNIYFSKAFVNPSSIGANIVLSGRFYVSSIDIAFLRDTGFYKQVTNPYQQGESDISLAYQKGCDFYRQQCSNDQFNEFCNESVKKCDQNYYGIAQCNQVMSQTPCRMFQVSDINQFCFNKESTYINYLNYYGSDSRCFESTLFKKDSSMTIKDQARCLKNYCINNNSQIIIYFNNEQFICQSENQKLQSAQNQGYILCPSNFETFCKQNIQRCQNNCSMNGLCINDKCECLSGYSGDYCQNIQCTENMQFGCQSCSNDGSNQCVKCYEGFYLSTNKQECLISCLIGEYKDFATQQCQMCPTGCKICQTQDICIECKDGMFLTAQNICVSQCADGFFKEQISVQDEDDQIFLKWVCSKCHHACTKCFGQEINQCTACHRFYTLININTCKHPKCDTNFYALNDKICIQCPSNCISCTANEMCYRCATGYILIGSKCYNSNCKMGQIFSFSSLKCEYCDEGCLECKGSTSFCLNCFQNYYLWNNQCLQTCSYGFYKQLYSESNNSQSLLADSEGSLNGKIISNTCQACHQLCGDCIGPLDTDCSSCPPEKYLNSEDQTCNQSQISNCLTALSETICLQCDAYFYLQDNKCQTRKCSPNFYAIRLDTEIGFLSISPSYLCLPCSQGCEVCSDQQVCQKCNTGFELNGQTNFCDPLPYKKSCQAGQYWDVQNKICQKCSNNCTKCRDQSICLECASNYKLILYTCEIIQCPPKTYYNSLLRQCEMCKTSCLSCQDANTCTECYDPTDVLFDNQCIHQCPSGYYPKFYENLKLTKCEKCDQTCKQCTDSNPRSCTVCKEGYEYYTKLQLCLLQCPEEGYFYDITILKCVQCIKNCNKCQELSECLVCQDGMFFNELNNTCQNCMDGCKMCQDQLTCDQCEVGSVYINNQCQKVCTVIDFNCVKCDPTTNICLQCQSGLPVQSNGFCPVKCTISQCQRCASSSQCAQCLDGYYLDINQQCQLKICQLNHCYECKFDKLIPQCETCIDGYQLSEDGYCSSTKCSQYGSSCIECQDDKFCKTCKKSFYYSLEYKQCLACKERCLSCDEFQCFEYNICPVGQYMLEKQCMNCFENCEQCNGPSQSDCQVSNQEQDCHYTCTECLGQNYNECISCPENRILTFYYNAKYGECKCPQGTYDILQIKCMEGYLDQIQRDLTVGFCYLGAIGVIAQSLVSLNPAMFYLLSEFAQTLGQIQYINIKKAYDFDETMYVLQHFNYNILSGVGSNVKPVEKNSTFRILDVRLEDLEKITSFYKSNNFIENSQVLIVLNVVCLNLMLIANYLVHQKKVRSYKKILSFIRVLRFSLPAFTLVLTSSEMCVTIQLQMKKFDLDSDQVFALLLSILFFTYQFVWIVIIIIQLGIKHSIKKKEHQLIFTIFNRKIFWQRIFLALLFIKKQFLSIILINVFKTPIKLLFIQLFTEAVFCIYIILMNPYRGSIYKRFALLNQFTYILVNIFLILISSNEDSQSDTKPILYIFILSLILIVLVLYSIFSFYLIIKTVQSKVTNNLINKAENPPILSQSRQQSISIRNFTPQQQNARQKQDKENKNRQAQVSSQTQIKLPINTELVQLDQEIQQDGNNQIEINNEDNQVDQEIDIYQNEIN